ncbi:hypothetical protein BH23GEM9_BH23GEM9_01560 [soil metagenome]
MRARLALITLAATTATASLLPERVAAQVADAAAPVRADAYLDGDARELVRQARIRRSMVDRRIQSYEVLAKERMSASLRAGIGERLLFRRETVSQIDWTRDTVRIEVLAAREVLPPVSGMPQIPADLLGYAPALAFDPVDSEMLLRFDSTSIRHPLGAGSEEHYRFASGDTTVIRLPDGRTVRLRELKILPRRRDPQLINGSFWLDMDTHAVVQAYFRLARGYDSQLDSDRSSVLGGMRAEIDYIGVEYGLWDLRWWMPRSVAARGVFQIGPVRMPLSFERSYHDYHITGDTTALPTVVDASDAIEPRPCRPRVRMAVQARIGEGGREAPADSLSADSAQAQRAGADAVPAERPGSPDRAARAAAGDSATICDGAFIVTSAPDAELLTSDLLPNDIYAAESDIIDSEVLRGIARRVRSIPEPPWQIGAPVIQWGMRGPGLIRYNRVEGLALGARTLLDLGRMRADAEVRVGTAAAEIGAQLGLQRDGDVVASRMAVYRRLDVADVATQPFTLGSSLTTLLLGRDENDYFRATGAEMTLRPPLARSQWYDMRLFAERHEAVQVETNFTTRRLLDSDRMFRDNIEADAADQLGAALRLRAAVGQNPAAPRFAAELELHGEAGDFRFARPAALVRATTPLGRRFAIGLEAAAGSSFGDVPVQRLWQIGGVATLRGFDAAAARGDTFWRGRGELGIGMTALRATLFSDIGWAGPRDDLQRGRPLQSLGGGLSFLDGLARVDLARARQTGTWKLHFQFKGGL